MVKAEELIRRFIQEVEIVFRQEAHEAALDTLAAIIEQSIGQDGRRSARRGRRREPAASATAPTKKAAPAPAGKRKEPASRIRRSSASLERDSRRLLEYVRRNPGALAEDVRRALNLGKAQWVTTVASVLASGQLKKQGHKRRTTFRVK